MTEREVIDWFTTRAVAAKLGNLERIKASPEMRARLYKIRFGDSVQASPIVDDMEVGNIEIILADIAAQRK